MAQRRMALWETEQDLNDVDISMAVGNYPQNGQFDEAQAQVDEATFAAMQQHIEKQTAFAQIPDPVKGFIVHFYQAIQNNNLAEITVAYESGWTKYTEKYYAKTEWPESDLIAPLVNDDPIFLILYRELYYRHVYSRLQPNIDDRYHSYENSCELFNYLLNSDGPVQLELPEQWLWDIIDEFIYQFQVFCTWRSKPKSKSEDELSMLGDGGPPVWTSYSVLNVLYSLISKSNINEHLAALREGKSAEEIVEIVGEYGAQPLYRMLGYFSLVGLLRVHVLLGDFTLGLKVMENVEMNQKAPFSRVTACHVATYYYVGFCYMMLRRYPDAIRSFVTILNFILRMRQFHTRSYQYDQINKTAERMYALFAICNALSPSRLDDSIANSAKEKYAEQVAKMSKGQDGLAAFEELFLYACPKFIAANSPPYDDSEVIATLIETPSAEPVQRHLSLFLADIQAQVPVSTLRSFLKLYTSLDAAKLANFLDADEEEMVQQMMVMKQASRSISRVGDEKSLLDGQTISTSDLNFVIDQNMVHIAEATVGRRYAGWFIKNTERAQRTFDELQHSALPPAPKVGSQGAANVSAESQAQPPVPKPTRQHNNKLAWASATKN